MAYIGKVSITNEWEKLEDLIKSQVSGQSAFAFDTDKKYSIQVDTVKDNNDNSAYFCNSATKPTNSDDGEHLNNDLYAEYKPESGVYLYVKKAKSLGVIKVSVSQI